MNNSSSVDFATMNRTSYQRFPLLPPRHARRSVRRDASAVTAHSSDAEASSNELSRKILSSVAACSGAALADPLMSLVCCFLLSPVFVVNSPPTAPRTAPDVANAALISARVTQFLQGCQHSCRTNRMVVYALHHKVYSFMTQRNPSARPPTLRVDRAQ